MTREEGPLPALNATFPFGMCFGTRAFTDPSLRQEQRIGSTLTPAILRADCLPVHWEAAKSSKKAL